MSYVWADDSQPGPPQPPPGQKAQPPPQPPRPSPPPPPPPPQPSRPGEPAPTGREQPAAQARPQVPVFHDPQDDTVILSVDDMTQITEALAQARQDSEDAGGQDGAPPAGSSPPPPAAGPGPPGQVPARRDPAQVQRAPSPAAPAGRDQHDLPPWRTVLVTTVRLWGRRQLARLWPSRARWRVLVVLVAALVVFGAGAITIGLTRGSPAGPASRSSGPFVAAATARRDAARWVARQVAPDAIVGCDPQMCAALQAAGVAASRLLVLGTGAGSGPSGSDVVVSTVAVRMEYGSRLTSVYAPSVLASFGSGNARVAVLEVAPDGAAAFLSSLQADRQARVFAGQQLLGNPAIHASPAVARALAAGAVDARLLSNFAALSHQYPVDITGVGAPGPGASAGLPLRSADIAPPAGQAGCRVARLDPRVPARAAGSVPAREYHRGPAGQLAR